MTSRSLVLSDASVLINFAHLGRLDLLGSLGLRVCIPEEAAAEVIHPRERLRMEAALATGWIEKAALTGPKALALYAELRLCLGAGESACLALAAAQGGLVACDEKRVFLREARRCLGEGRVLNTPGLFLLALRRGLLSVEEADEAKLRLEGHRFRMAFASFRDLL